MTRRGTVWALIAAAVLVSGAKCSPSELDALQAALHDEGGVSAEILGKARSVKTLSGLSGEDLALQRQLLAETDARVLRSAAAAMDTTISSARSTADADAEATASAAVIGEVPSKFTEDLKEVTKEMVKDQACQAILDQVAPAPDEPGEGKDWSDLVLEVVNRMVARQWKQPASRWDNFVAWEEYASKVTQDGNQLAHTLLTDTSSIELFFKPQMQRAALAYARFCYATPRLP